MTARDFLQKFIEAMPSRGLDNVDIYIHSPGDDDESDCYKIVSISNEDANDAVSIRIKKIY